MRARFSGAAFAQAMMVTAVMMAMMLEMLDMTVVNVALPHMMGAFGATNDQITWVVTSYMISSAIVMPLTGYFVSRFGRRRLLIADIVLFLVASAACGASRNIEQMVAFRILQGAAGGSLAPLAQAVMMSSFSRENRGSAMAVFGLGMMVIPVMGPTLGGFLTDHLDWRWVFYVNIPVGLFALLLASAYVPGESMKQARTDWVGMALLIVFIGALQAMLNQGNARDWFNSSLIQGLSVVAAVGGVLFIAHCWRRSDAIVYLGVFRDRNFTLSTMLTVGFSMAMFGVMTLLPLLLEQLLHYPAQVVGNVMAPRGIVMAVAIVLFGRFAGRFDGRHMAFAGILILGAGTYAYALLPMNMSPLWVMLPGFLQGIGMAMFFIPSAMLAYETMPKHLYDGAAGLYSVMRTISSSLGIAVIGLLLARRSEYHWQVLSEFVSEDNPNLHAWLDQRDLSMADPTAAAALVGAVMQQVQMLAFKDMFFLVALVPIFIGPLVYFRKRPPTPSLASG